MRQLFAMTVVVTLGGLSAAFAQSPVGDPAKGHELARKTCIQCHRVERGEHEERRLGLPAFQDLADHQATTALSLRVFLQTSHKNMPNLVLTPQETDDLTAYILSLK